MDRMRESLFSILGPLDGLTFLDLFTGSGVLALEAVSRGASSAQAVELDRGKKEVILKNLTMANQKVQLTIQPAERFVMTWKKSFDIIFLDPPFDYPHKADLLQRVASSRLVHPGTRILIHYPGENTLPTELSAPRLRGRADIPDFFRTTGETEGDSEAQSPVQGWKFFVADQRDFGRSKVRFFSATFE